VADRPHPSRIGPWGLGYVTLSALCLGTAGYASYRIGTLQSSAAWIDDRVHSQAGDYEATLQSRFVDQEMQSFRERHELLSAASAWWQVRLGVLMAWVLGSFAYYIHRVISGFSEELTDQARA
jgi:hypothetical protein